MPPPHKVRFVKKPIRDRVNKSNRPLRGLTRIWLILSNLNLEKQMDFDDLPCAKLENI